MDARSIGRIVRADDVEPAKLILFAMPSGSEVGLVVQLGQDTRGILHFEAKREGRMVPAIYDINNFYNEMVVVIDSARIVPVFAPEHVGFGNYAGGHISQVIYINERAVFMRATNGHYATTVNLMSGRSVEFDGHRCAYTKAWYIEVLDADGSYEPFFEVRVQP